MLIKKKNTLPKFTKITIEGYNSFYVINKNIMINGYWDAGRLKKALKVRIIDDLGVIPLNSYLDIHKVTIETDKRKAILTKLELTHSRQMYGERYYEFTVFGQTEILKWDN